MDSRVAARFAGLAVIPEGTSDLLRQPLVQAVDQDTNVLDDVAPSQILPAARAGIKDLPQIVQDVDDFAIAGKGAVAEVVDAAALVVGLDDPQRERGQRLLQKNLGTQDQEPFAIPPSMSPAAATRDQNKKAHTDAIIENAPV